MRTDTRMQDDVRAAFERDPRIDDPSEIAVYADEIGAVTLRGTVGSLLQRLAAVHDTRQVDGVFSVIDQLKVHLPLPDRRADDEIRGEALRRLISDEAVHSNHIEVAVSAGRVTLTGRVMEEAERARAEEDVASLTGVVGIDNHLDVD